MPRSPLQRFRLPLIALCGLPLAAALHAETQLQFQPATDYAVRLFPVSVTATDLDGDDFPDLAVSNGNVASVSVLLNNRQGGFANAIDVNLAGIPFGIASGPLDADADADVVVTLAAMGSVQLVWNLGGGQFSAGPSYLVGDTPRSVATADFNGDLALDLVVANRESDNVSVLLNQGGGLFAEATSYSCGERPREVAAADMNGDGLPDMIVANQRTSDVAVLFNQGRGTFGRPSFTLLPTGLDPETLAVGDLDGDHDVDVAVAGIGATGGLAVVLLNDGAPTLSVVAQLPAGGDPAAVRIGDLNGDGLAELVVAERAADEVRAYLNGHGGDFAVPGLFRVGPDPYYITLDDFNQDQRLDIATPNSLADSVSVLLNATPNVRGDLDRDGDLDAIDLRLFVRAVVGLPEDPAHLTHADMNNDHAVNGLDAAPFVTAFVAP